MEYIIVGLIIGICILLYVCINTYRKYLYFESEYNKLVKNQELIEKRVLKALTFFKKLFGQAKMEMDRVDKNGSFSSDDEVGFAFTTINEAIHHVSFQLDKVNELINGGADETTENKS